MDNKITDRATLLAYNKQLLDSYFKFYDGLDLVLPQTNKIQDKEKLGDAHAELLARVFLLAVPVIKNDLGYRVTGKMGVTYLLADVLRSWVRAASNPRYSSYLPAGKRNGQPTLEACYLALAILATHDIVNYRLTDVLKTWLLAHLKTPVHKNNWSVAKLGLTMLLTEHFSLSSFELQDVKDSADSAFEVIHNSYAGSGWYFDGLNIDYYSAWSMIWWLCQSKASAALSKKIVPVVSHVSSNLVVDQFLQTYELIFDSRGRSPEWGRSAIYRFAASSPIAAAAEAAAIPEDRLGRLKDVLLGNVNAFVNQSILDEHGQLTLDFTDKNAAVDFYSSYPSPLWAAKTFWILNLPETTPFWLAKRVSKPKESYDVKILDKLRVRYSATADVVELSSGYKLTTIDGVVLDDCRYDTVRSTNW